MLSISVTVTRGECRSNLRRAGTCAAKIKEQMRAKGDYSSKRTDDKKVFIAQKEELHGTISMHTELVCDVARRPQNGRRQARKVS